MGRQALERWVGFGKDENSVSKDMGAPSVEEKEEKSESTASVEMEDRHQRAGGSGRTGRIPGGSARW